jgi:hypothetical protein
MVEPNQDQYSGAKSNRLYQALANPKHQVKLLFGIHEIHWTPFFIKFETDKDIATEEKNCHKAVMAQVIGFMKMGQPKIWREVEDLGRGLNHRKWKTSRTWSTRPTSSWLSSLITGTQNMLKKDIAKSENKVSNWLESHDQMIEIRIILLLMFAGGKCGDVLKNMTIQHFDERKETTYRRTWSERSLQRDWRNHSNRNFWTQDQVIRIGIGYIPQEFTARQSLSNLPKRRSGTI